MFLLFILITNINVVLSAADELPEDKSTASVRRSARVRIARVLEKGTKEDGDKAVPSKRAAKAGVEKRLRTSDSPDARRRRPSASKDESEVEERKEKRLTPDDIQLVPGKGSAKEVMFYWHIFTEEQRRGYVSIIESEFEGIGSGPSIQIFINKKDQGKHIGSCAYEAACLASGLPEVYAHMRKSNIASKKAAMNAGFVIDKRYTGAQLLMVWLRRLAHR